MPLSKYFSGSGEKVMKDMKKEYGSERGKRIFYATVNKRKKHAIDPSEHVMRKMKNG